MTLLGAASRVRLAVYAKHIVALAERLAEFWWVISFADVKMRRDHLERVLRICIKKHAAGDLPEFNPVHPWDICYRDCTKDVEFWEAEVIGKIRDLKGGFITAEQILDMGFGKLVLKDGTVLDTNHPQLPRPPGYRGINLKPRFPSRSRSAGSSNSPPEQKQTRKPFEFDQQGIQICGDFSNGRCNKKDCELSHACCWCRAKGNNRKTGSHLPANCASNPHVAAKKKRNPPPSRGRRK